MYLEVNAFPELVLVRAPTLERGQDVGTPPDRWVFTEARHPMFQIPDDALPRYLGWHVSTKLRRVDDDSEVSTVVTVTAKPGIERALGEVLRTVRTHANSQDGCVNYYAQRDVHNRCTFVISETCSNRITFEARGVSAHIDVYKRAVGTLVDARGANVTRAMM
jgi:quinol monooxygenase YgiN